MIKNKLLLAFAAFIFFCQ